MCRPAAEISMLAVVNAVEPIARIEKCPLSLRGHGVRLCPLHQRLDHAYALVEKAFADEVMKALK